MLKASDEDKLAVMLGIAGFVYFDPKRRLYFTQKDQDAQEEFRKSKKKKIDYSDHYEK